MAGRTNKKWIAAKKAQLAKQAGRLKWQQKFNYPKRNLSLDLAKELAVVGAKTNPSGRTYNWFLKWRKICWETRMRIDPDGYRLIKMPNGWMDFVEVPISGWVRKKLVKRNKQI